MDSLQRLPYMQDYSEEPSQQKWTRPGTCCWDKYPVIDWSQEQSQCGFWEIDFISGDKEYTVKEYRLGAPYQGTSLCTSSHENMNSI